MFPPATNNSLLVSAIVIAEIVASFNGEKETAGELPISKQIISNSTRIAQAAKFIQDWQAYCKHVHSWVTYVWSYIYVAVQSNEIIYGDIRVTSMHVPRQLFAVPRAYPLYSAVDKQNGVTG